MTITILRSFYAALTLAAAAATLADKQQQGLSIDVGPLIRKRVFQDGAQTTSTIPEDDKEMLDIVLVASVDGKFHALNRVNGHVIWSMSSLHTTTPALAALSPLVQTDHPEIDPDMHDGQEQYIIEPQSGDIYVLSDPTGPLQRLPFSMSKLVDISPYRFSDGDITRVFVGKKETSLLVIELETGRLLRTINSECPWEPPLAESGIREIDLDDLEDSNTPPATSTHIYIGRTGKCIALIVSSSAHSWQITEFPFIPHHLLVVTSHPRYKTFLSRSMVQTTRTCRSNPYISARWMIHTSNPCLMGKLSPLAPGLGPNFKTGFIGVASSRSLW
jgi:hypothetical protein